LIPKYKVFTNCLLKHKGSTTKDKHISSKAILALNLIPRPLARISYVTACRIVCIFIWQVHICCIFLFVIFIKFIF